MLLFEFSNILGLFDKDHYASTLGYLVAIICGIIILTELYTVIKQKSDPDFLFMLLTGVIAGLVQGLTQDLLLALLSGLCWLMVVSVWTIRESPVWRELMLASLISYFVVLSGRIIQVVIERLYGVTGTVWGLTGQQWFGIGWNIFIYVFFIMCIIFFGRRFFLVSRLTSPQIIYLLFFGLSYFLLYQFSGELNFYYKGVPQAVADRVLFASFGTYEIMIIANFALYLISGPLLNLIFGVKPVEDKRVLSLVEEVRTNLGIKNKVRVGRVKAPILNAFAYGAFFDKRIAFMSKELEDFTDDDIRGIAGHELAHAHEVHTLWLFLITSVTFAITKALQLPATTLDYIFDPNVGFDFLWYYLYNIGLVGFSYIFVRMLEGRADLRTLKAGYGKPLAKALVRLEGFYQGIASEMGLSVYLLTDKEQTKAEKIRFLGDASRKMYNSTIDPSKMDCLMNLIASHPRSVFRVTALMNPEKLPPIKAAMFPILLLIPFVRQQYLRELRENRQAVKEVIDETFVDTFNEAVVENYTQLSHYEAQNKIFIGKDVVVVSKIDQKEFYTGKVSSLEKTESISTPLKLQLKTAKEEKIIPLSDFTCTEFAIGQKQIFKDGKIGIITKLNEDEKEFSFDVTYPYNGTTDETHTKTLKHPGTPLRFLEDIVGNSILLYQKGVHRLAHLNELKVNGQALSQSSFTLNVDGETKTI
ncbi:hypothetical protein EU523_01980, partial [Candidatus Heimdallarchaeota archaeon]